MSIKGACSSTDCKKCQNKSLTTQSHQRSGAWAHHSCEDGQIISADTRAIHFSPAKQHDKENLLSAEDDIRGLSEDF